MNRTRVKSMTFPSARDIAFAAAGAVLGVSGLAPGVAPFGLAFMCAVPRKRRGYVLGGVLAASLLDECIPLAVFSAVFAFAVLYWCDKRCGGVNGLTRILAALGVSALRATYIAVTSDGSPAAVLALIAAAAAYPVFVYAFRGYFDKKRELHAARYEFSLLAYAFAFSASLCRVTVYGVPASILPAGVFTLIAARRRGFAYGGACGVLCGIASGGAATGALGVAGMVYGMLKSELEPAALVLSFMLSVSGYFYLSGPAETAVAGAMLIAANAVFILIRKRISSLSPTTESAAARMNDRRMARYAAAFSSLSRVFYTVSAEARAETVTELNARAVSAVRTVCDRCPKCMGCTVDRAAISNFFTSEFRRAGAVTYSSIPTHISAECASVCAMARLLNRSTDDKAAKSENGLARMADEYSAVSGLLCSAAGAQEDRGRNDRTLAKRLKEAFIAAGVKCDGVRAVGSRLREITVYGVRSAGVTKSPAELSRLVGSLVGTSVSPPEIVINDGYELMRFATVPRLRAETAKLSEAKHGETVSGDTVSVFENDDGYFYCLVSDGMGSGRDAMLTSRLSAIVLEKLLSVGADKEAALRLLNKALCEKNGEVFATVDLLEIDRVLGRASVIKAGAAPTLLLRGGKCTLISSETPPAGIMRDVIAEKNSFSVLHGDVIIMLSDGVLQTESGNELIPREGLPPMPSARALASYILERARTLNECADDMSVCVVRII